MNKIIKQNERGALIIISGPSGSGKGTIVEELVKRNKNIWLSISCTSRPIRHNETPNKSYFFLTEEEFLTKLDKGEFLEHNLYNGNYYGTPKVNIEEKLQAGIDVILEIDVNGARQVKEKLPETICVFILPPSLEELKKRLIGRGTETRETLLGRFKAAYQEINEITTYNYVVINDTLEEAVKKVESIISSEKSRVDRIEEVYLANTEEKLHELLMEQEFVREDIKL